MKTEDLKKKLATGRSFRDICPDTIDRVVAQCAWRYKPKDLEKAVKEKLHGYCSAFMTETQYKRAEACLPQMNTEEGLSEVLAQHVSTRERLPLSSMDALYARLWAVTGPPQSVLDLACGLNPLYLGNRLSCRVVGLDMSGASIRLINQAGYGERVKARCADLLCVDAIPEEHFHVALLFKVLPLLERQENGAAGGILQRISADFIITSFPLRTLTGKNIGMEAHYSEWMETHIPKSLCIQDRINDAGREVYYILRAVQREC